MFAFVYCKLFSIIENSKKSKHVEAEEEKTIKNEHWKERYLITTHTRVDVFIVYTNWSTNYKYGEMITSNEFIENDN